MDFGNSIGDYANLLAQFWAFGKLCLKLLTQLFIFSKTQNEVKNKTPANNLAGVLGNILSFPVATKANLKFIIITYIDKSFASC